MKIKAKLTLDFCSYNNKECGYSYDPYGDNMENCENYMRNRDTCIYYRIKEIYIDKEYKDISIEYSESGNDIVLKLDRKKYINDYRYSDIEYLYIDEKEIVKEYKIVRES